MGGSKAASAALAGLVIGALVAGGSPARAQSTAPPAAAAASGSAVDAAWAYYHRTLDAARAKLLAHPFADTPKRRAEALYLISEAAVVGFNMYVGPRQDYPSLYIQPIFLNNMYGWGLPNPDFLYRWAFIDGAKTYRIWGRRNDPTFVDLQLQSGFWGDQTFSVLSNTLIDSLQTGPDGSFEVILSPTPHPGNWIKTDPTAHSSVIQMRQAMIDWAHDRPVDIHIDEVDRPAGAPLMYSPEEYADRLRRAADFVTHNVDFIYRMNERLSPGLQVFNSFRPLTEHPNSDEGGSRFSSHPMAIFDIGKDDALIIETDIPHAKYWGVQLGDVWWQTSDYKFHQSSLNAHTAVIDKDGKLRVVLSHVDPGVPNWLDPADDDRGTIQFRWYYGDAAPIPVVVKRVKASEVRKYLPPDTPVVSPDQRRAALAERWAGVERMYGQ
ncbi:MAG: DUF1214 domain-containing protein [Mycobacterium sp.]|uniref:DUF1214 domain-containing protein n=1 Tax=Mycobacterium sp. TaxID=1785 RepID=UPI001EB4030E|nr:DUF1214 domain-containing protein [Mycobacterium sp.]MBV8788220.1 DUF1214 domain-containing protein [Mycobacterium sp.]